MRSVINKDINSLSAVQHITDIVSTIFRKVNFKQTTIITKGQLVYDVLTTLQLANPFQYVEDKIMDMLGGLNNHMEIVHMV